MDKDLLIDDVLKEKAGSEVIVLPRNLEMRIKETLKSLLKGKRTKSPLFKGTAAAAVAVVIVTTLSAAFPAYARNVPVVKSVFQFLSDKDIIDKEYVVYSSDLNLSRTSSDVTVSINSIVYDGIDLSIAYTVESKEEMKGMPHILDKELKINGKVIGFGSGGTGNFINNKTYVGVDSFDMAKDYLPKEIRKGILGGNVNIPDTFILDLNIREFSNSIKGKWDFKFKVSKEKIKGRIQEVKTSVDLSALRPGLEIREVIFTPINTALRAIEDAGGEGHTTDMIQYIAFDDKGRRLEVKGASGSGSEKVSKVYWQYTFRNVYEDTKSVTFIPTAFTKEYEEKVKNSNGEWESEKKEILLNMDKPSTLSEGKLGEYKITKIEPLENKTVVHYECNGIMAEVQPYNLFISDDEGKDYPFLKESVKDLGNNKYTTELEPLSKDKQYKLWAVDYEKMYEVREDLKFTVEVNK